jgi:hypothetical protein
MDVIKATRQMRISDLVAWETDPIFTRENITLLAGSGSVRSVLMATVLGAVVSGTATSAAKAGGNAANTGTFVLDVSTPVLDGAKTGVYKLRCITAATNGGTFRLTDPDGDVVDDFTITGGAGGTATVNKQIKGVLTDGATDFSVGEGFDISVVETEKAIALDVTATNGAERARSVALFDASAPDGTDGTVTVIKRGPAILRSSALIWPAGITAAQKSIALAQLESQGIIVRTDG